MDAINVPSADSFATGERDPTTAALDCDLLGEDHASLRRSLSNRLEYSIGKDPLTATTRDWFYTAAAAVRERLIER